MKLSLITLQEGSEYKIQSANGALYLRGSKKYAEYVFEQMQKAVEAMEAIPNDARHAVLDGLARLY